MRTREDIESQFKNITIDSMMADAYRLFFELLLDIRQLLAEERDARLLSQVSQARKQAEAEREAKVTDDYVKKVEDAKGDL